MLHKGSKVFCSFSYPTLHYQIRYISRLAVMEDHLFNYKSHFGIETPSAHLLPCDYIIAPVKDYVKYALFCAVVTNR